MALALTPDQIVTLTGRLNDAQAAYHNLILGIKASTVVDQNGERVTFTPANQADLAAYIDTLKNQLGLTDRSSMPRALKFIF